MKRKPLDVFFIVIGLFSQSVSVGDAGTGCSVPSTVCVSLSRFVNGKTFEVISRMAIPGLTYLTFRNALEC